MGFLDTLFIFAGLFSAVVATFVTQTTQSLQQDYSAVTASLLTEMIALQRATAIGGDVGSVPHSALAYNSTFTSTPRDVGLNSLWLASLSLTLVTALMAGLIKQWLHYYLADVTGATPKDRACTRQYRYIGLNLWGVSGIIEILPVLMNTSLLLFFLGLILFTQDLSGMIGITQFLIGLTCTSFVIYFGSSLLPVWIPQCPYKTSLSKLYSSLLQYFWFILMLLLLFWKLLVDLIVWSGIQNLKLITKWCDHMADVCGSRLFLSLRTTEAQAVKDQETILKQDVVEEMAVNSTNPTVCEIGLQSVAALYIDQQRESSPRYIPFGKLQEHFYRCFQYDPSNKYNFRITFPPSVVERYSRAMLVCKDYSQSNIWNRILSFSTPPNDLSSAFFCAYAMNNGELPTKTSKLIIQCVLDQPPIEVNKYHWHHHRFAKAIDTATLSDLYSAEEQRQLLVVLVKSLSPQRALTLQEVLLIHYLYAFYNEAGVTVQEEQVLTENLDLELSDGVIKNIRATLIRFIILLPDIADCAFSLSSEEHHQLLLHLRGMNFYGTTGGVSMRWGKKWVNLNKDQPEFSSCVNSLIKLLNQLTSSWEEWSGDVLIRLDVIADLHFTLQFHAECNERVIHSMSHWLLVISLQGWENANSDEQTRIKYGLVEVLFQKPFFSNEAPKNHLHDSLKAFCDFVVSKQLLGLPSVIFGDLSEHFGYLLKHSNESVVIDCLDLLFRHFLWQAPLRVDHNYPMVHEDQKTTIYYLINFTHKQQSRSVKWEVMLTSWHQLVNDKIMKSTCIGEIFEASEISPRKPDDWMDAVDLQDVLWMFEEEDTSNIQNEDLDPWDLQDVLWMFEKEIPLGDPLDLHQLKRQLDKVLGEVNKPSPKTKVRRGFDVTRLFKGAPKDPYPPADNL